MIWGKKVAERLELKKLSCFFPSNYASVMLIMFKTMYWFNFMLCNFRCMEIHIVMIQFISMYHT